MTETDRQRLSRRALILKSLAHPSRLLVMELLEKGPRCVTELTEAVGADMTTVSKHLAVLRRTGLVRVTRHGTYSQYELACGCVGHFIDCIEGGIGTPRRIRGGARAGPREAREAPCPD